MSQILAFLIIVIFVWLLNLYFQNDRLKTQLKKNHDASIRYEKEVESKFWALENPPKFAISEVIGDYIVKSELVNFKKSSAHPTVMPYPYRQYTVVDTKTFDIIVCSEKFLLNIKKNENKN
jgi:hypothetical protein